MTDEEIKLAKEAIHWCPICLRGSLVSWCPVCVPISRIFPKTAPTPKNKEKI